jgi:hypothetical protein
MALIIFTYMTVVKSSSVVVVLFPVLIRQCDDVSSDGECLMRGFVASSRFPHNTHTQCARTRRKGYNECPRWMCTAVCVSTLPVIYPL